MNTIDHTLSCDYPIDYLYFILFYFFCLESAVRQRKRLYHHNVFCSLRIRS